MAVVVPGTEVQQAMLVVELLALMLVVELLALIYSIPLYWRTSAMRIFGAFKRVVFMLGRRFHSLNARLVSATNLSRTYTPSRPLETGYLIYTFMPFGPESGALPTKIPHSEVLYLAL